MCRIKVNFTNTGDYSNFNTIREVLSKIGIPIEHRYNEEDGIGWLVLKTKEETKTIDQSLQKAVPKVIVAMEKVLEREDVNNCNCT